MKFNVTDIEFDFDDDYAEESKLTYDEEIAIRDLALGVWEADNEDEIKQAFPDRVTDNEYIFIYDRGMTPNEITLNVEWLD